MGENLVATQDGGRPLMRFRENTILSFNRAADAGASFVEFDVQVQLSRPTHTIPCGQLMRGKLHMRRIMWPALIKEQDSKRQVLHKSRS